MTKQELEKLKELATEVDKLREKAERKLARLLNLYQEDEDVEDPEAHDSLTKAVEYLHQGAWRLGCAETKIREARKLEKARIDFYEGLLRKQDNDKE